MLRLLFGISLSLKLHQKTCRGFSLRQAKFDCPDLSPAISDRKRTKLGLLFAQEIGELSNVGA